MPYTGQVGGSFVGAGSPSSAPSTGPTAYTPPTPSSITSISATPTPISTSSSGGFTPSGGTSSTGYIPTYTPSYGPTITVTPIGPVAPTNVITPSSLVGATFTSADAVAAGIASRNSGTQELVIRDTSSGNVISPVRGLPDRIDANMVRIYGSDGGQVISGGQAVTANRGAGVYINIETANQKAFSSDPGANYRFVADVQGLPAGWNYDYKIPSGPQYVDEQVLKQTLAQPQQEIQSNFFNPYGARGTSLSEARVALNVPAEMRTVEQQNSIYEAAGLSVNYANKLEARNALIADEAGKMYAFSKTFDQPRTQTISFADQLQGQLRATGEKLEGTLPYANLALQEKYNIESGILRYFTPPIVFDNLTPYRRGVQEFTKGVFEGGVMVGGLVGEVGAETIQVGKTFSGTKSKLKDFPIFSGITAGAISLYSDPVKTISDYGNEEINRLNESPLKYAGSFAETWFATEGLGKVLLATGKGGIVAADLGKATAKVTTKKGLGTIGEILENPRLSPVIDPLYGTARQLGERGTGFIDRFGKGFLEVGEQGSEFTQTVGSRVYLEKLGIQGTIGRTTGEIIQGGRNLVSPIEYGYIGAKASVKDFGENVSGRLGIEALSLQTKVGYALDTTSDFVKNNIFIYKPSGTGFKDFISSATVPIKEARIEFASFKTGVKSGLEETGARLEFRASEFNRYVSESVSPVVSKARLYGESFASELDLKNRLVRPFGSARVETEMAKIRFGIAKKELEQRFGSYSERFSDVRLRPVGQVKDLFENVSSAKAEFGLKVRPLKNYLGEYKAEIDLERIFKPSTSIVKKEVPGRGLVETFEVKGVKSPLGNTQLVERTVQEKSLLNPESIKDYLAGRKPGQVIKEVKEKALGFEIEMTPSQNAAYRDLADLAGKKEIVVHVSSGKSLFSKAGEVSSQTGVKSNIERNIAGMTFENPLETGLFGAPSKLGVSANKLESFLRANLKDISNPNIPKLGELKSALLRGAAKERGVIQGGTGLGIIYPELKIPVNDIDVLARVPAKLAKAQIAEAKAAGFKEIKLIRDADKAGKYGEPGKYIIEYKGVKVGETERIVEGIDLYKESKFIKVGDLKVRSPEQTLKDYISISSEGGKNFEKASTRAGLLTEGELTAKSFVPERIARGYGYYGGLNAESQVSLIDYVMSKISGGSEIKLGGKPSSTIFLNQTIGEAVPKKILEAPIRKGELQEFKDLVAKAKTSEQWKSYFEQFPETEKVFFGRDEASVVKLYRALKYYDVAAKEGVFYPGAASQAGIRGELEIAAKGGSKGFPVSKVYASTPYNKGMTLQFADLIEGQAKFQPNIKFITEKVMSPDYKLSVESFKSFIESPKSKVATKVYPVANIEKGLFEVSGSVAAQPYFNRASSKSAYFSGSVVVPSSSGFSSFTSYNKSSFIPSTSKSGSVSSSVSPSASTSASNSFSSSASVSSSVSSSASSSLSSSSSVSSSLSLSKSLSKSISGSSSASMFFEEKKFLRKRKNDELSSQEKKLQKGFKSFIRRKGKFIEVSKEILPRNLALQRGTQKALTTLGRSVTLKEAGYTDLTDITQVPEINKFRARLPTSKIPGEPVYVQKTEFSIGSSGEKQELKAARNIKRMMKGGLKFGRL